MKALIQGSFPTFSFQASGGDTAEVVFGLLTATVGLLSQTRKPTTTNEDIVRVISENARLILSINHDEILIDKEAILNGGGR